MLNKTIIVLKYYRNEHLDLFTGAMPNVYDK
jgi:hypothetical protein